MNHPVLAEHSAVYAAALAAAVAAGYDNTKTHPITRRTRAAGVATWIRNNLCTVNEVQGLTAEQITSAVASMLTRYQNEME